jgi:hypothetical protein
VSVVPTLAGDGDTHKWMRGEFYWKPVNAEGWDVLFTHGEVIDL